MDDAFVVTLSFQVVYLVNTAPYVVGHVFLLHQRCGAHCFNVGVIGSFFVLCAVEEGTRSLDRSSKLWRKAAFDDGFRNVGIFVTRRSLCDFVGSVGDCFRAVCSLRLVSAACVSDCPITVSILLRIFEWEVTYASPPNTR